MPLFFLMLVIWRRLARQMAQACERRAHLYPQRPPGRLNATEQRVILQAKAQMQLPVDSPLSTTFSPTLTATLNHHPQENDMSDIQIKELALWRKAGFEHLLIDVRRDVKRAAEADEISGGQWHNPALWMDWKDQVAATAPGQPIVVYCAYGHELSQALAVCLRALGRDARHLTGGIEVWRKAGLPVAVLTKSGGSS